MVQNRGILKEGYAADIVIFDEQKVGDRSTYDNPHQYSVGFQYVLVNGQLTVENGKHTGIRGGTTLRLKM